MDMSAKPVEIQPLTFFDAISSKNVEAVKELLRTGEDPNKPDSEGWTPLHCAIDDGNYEITHVLLLNEADDSVYTEKDGWLGIHIAAYNGRADIVELLIKAGSQVDAKSKSNDTPLFWAIDQGHKDVVTALISAGCDVNIRNGNAGITALHLAIELNNVEIVKILVENDADVTLPTLDVFGWSSISIAAHMGHADLVKILKPRFIDLNLKCKSGRTPLYWAVKGGHLEVVRILFDTATDENIARPIHKIKYIAPDANIPDNFGWTPLHSASFNGNLEIAKLLIENGALVNTLTESLTKWAPIHIAACKKHNDIVELIISNGGSVNLTDAIGNTALHWTIYKKNGKIVQKLLDAGININIRNKKGNSALDIAQIRGYKKICLMLKMKNISVPKAIQIKRAMKKDARN